MPYTMNDLDDVRIYYEFAGGDGPPLVLLHDSLSSSAIWQQLGYVEWLAEEYRVIMIDARGHGRSDKPDEEAAYTMPLIASDVIAVLDRAGVERAHFLGYGMGGSVAYGLGLHAPERFDSFIIGGGALARSHEAALARMTMPVLLFAGGHDLDGLRDARLTAGQLPDATLIIIPVENHATTIVRPDKVLPHILAFLARVTGAQPQAA
jgi:pimeloyl-ACP methyl ester carboxylesterase